MHPAVTPAEAERIAVDRARACPIRSACSSSTCCASTPGKVCVCELTPLFDVSQPTVSHHLKVLREAGLVDVERRGLWAYYYVIPEATKELSTWLR